MGNLGDVKPVGQGVYEALISYGPGYRLYYAIRKHTIIWLICGGDKRSQKQDIQKAQKILKEVERRYD
ncbi:MAG: addiction module killer protein [Kiritimatiellae bacterium]|nr:addiction module killer protein [Kiritimatiellia bacterium]MDD4737077.1 addiction module killer protein [Kiritimatiellia bacterium]